MIIDRVTFFNSLAMKPLFSHLPASHLSDGGRETLPALNNACSQRLLSTPALNNGRLCLLSTAAAELISERGNHKTIQFVLLFVCDSALIYCSFIFICRPVNPQDVKKGEIGVVKAWWLYLLFNKK